MFKKIFHIVFAFVIMFVTSNSVFASCTSIIDGPSFAAGKEHNGSKYSLQSAYATATGNNAKTFFYNLYSLSGAFYSWNDRIITFKLMEKDGILSNDDLVKTYTGTFIGRTLDAIRLTTTNMPGNIEAEGDSTSELYLRSYFLKHSEDPSSKTRSFFDYQLCQD